MSPTHGGPLDDHKKELCCRTAQAKLDTWTAIYETLTPKKRDAAADLAGKFSEGMDRIFLSGDE